MKELKWRLLFWTFKQSYKIEEHIQTYIKDEKYNYNFGKFADKVQRYLVKDIINYNYDRDYKYLGEFPIVNNYGFSDSWKWCIQDNMFDAVFNSKNYNEMMFNLGAIKFELDMIQLYYNREWEDLTKTANKVA